MFCSPSLSCLFWNFGASRWKIEAPPTLLLSPGASIRENTVKAILPNSVGGNNEKHWIPSFDFCDVADLDLSRPYITNPFIDLRYHTIKVAISSGLPLSTEGVHQQVVSVSLTWFMQITCSFAVMYGSLGWPSDNFFRFSFFIFRLSLFVFDILSFAFRF